MLLAFRFAVLLLLCASSVLAAAQVNDDALAAARPQRLLSAYGLFSDARQQRPGKGVVPYDLQVPLFTDYAEKYRFVYVPDGQAALYHESEVFDFPVGSVLVKTFAYPADLRQPDKDIRLIETRLLIRQDTGWNAWAYVWNEEQTDAILKVAGKVLPVDFIDLAGAARSISYIVPNKNQCKGWPQLQQGGYPDRAEGAQPEQRLRLSGQSREPDILLDRGGHSGRRAGRRGHSVAAGCGGYGCPH